MAERKQDKQAKIITKYLTGQRCPDRIEDVVALLKKERN